MFPRSGRISAHQSEVCPHGHRDQHPGGPEAARGHHGPGGLQELPPQQGPTSWRDLKCFKSYCSGRTILYDEEVNQSHLRLWLPQGITQDTKKELLVLSIFMTDTRLLVSKYINGERDKQALLSSFELISRKILKK